MDIVDSIVMSGSAAAEAASYIEEHRKSPVQQAKSEDVYA
jgi:hypothetical protein